MSMFPGAGARIFRNEAGEPIGWDYPSDDQPDYDPDRYLDSDYPYNPDDGEDEDEDEDEETDPDEARDRHRDDPDLFDERGRLHHDG